MSWLSSLDGAAADRERAGLRRRLRPRAEDDGLIDLAGNDYLGLSRHPDVAAAATAALKGYGLGATASRLVRGSTDLHAQLEAALAELFGCEAALVYSSGYLANLGAVRAVDWSMLASDRHNHASLVDGCRLARSSPTVVYAHADPSSLDSSLPSGAGRWPALVVTESVFSVHGDLAPLAALHGVARRRGAVLLVDDAHAVGVLGPRGAGAVAAAGMSGQPDVLVTATLSKALGAAGGVVAGPSALIRHLVETSRTFIYDTGLSPAVAAGALAALEVVRGPAGDRSRVELADRAHGAWRRLSEAGLRAAEPAAGVLSVEAPGPDEALAWAEACRDRGVAVGCFRPPSTPDGESRLRLTVNVGVPRADFERALSTIISVAPGSVAPGSLPPGSLSPGSGSPGSGRP
jgi:8-amino-7-oxononanoate synthase